MEPLILSIFLVILLILFVSEKMQYDIAGLLIVFLLVVLTELNIGLNFLSTADALSGFANKAVITIAAMFIISAGLMRTGAVGFLGDKIISYSKGKPGRVLMLSMVAVAISSAFINNTPVVVLFVPIMLKVCYKYQLSPSKYLIPISYASILGGSTTLIGSSANIVVSGIASKIGEANPALHLHKFTMYEFAPVGLPIAIVGILFIFLFGRKVLPDRKTVTSSLADSKQKSFMTEMEIQYDSSAIGQTVESTFLKKNPGLLIMEVIRGERIIYPPVNDVVLELGDILLTKGSVNEILDIQREGSAIIAPELGVDHVRFTEKDYTLAEAVLMPTSQFVGKTIEEVQFHRRYDVTVIAILRRGRHMHIQEKIRTVELAVGDTLLVQGGAESIGKMRNAENVLLLEGIKESVINKRKAPIAIATILSVVVGATFNLLPIAVLAVLGAIVMILTDCIPIKEAYKSMDASVLTLIASTIGLGVAMKNTGTAAMYANFLVSHVKDFGPLAVLAVLFLLTTFLSNYVNKSAAAVLMVPVAVAASQAPGFGLEPMPFVMAVLFGASACLMTPIGYQTNLFIYGPGGYKFTDYLKLGAPLVVIMFIMTMILVPMVWPFIPVH